MLIVTGIVPFERRSEIDRIKVKLKKEFNNDVIIHERFNYISYSAKVSDDTMYL